MLSVGCERIVRARMGPAMPAPMMEMVAFGGVDILCGTLTYDEMFVPSKRREDGGIGIGE